MVVAKWNYSGMTNFNQALILPPSQQPQRRPHDKLDPLHRSVREPFPQSGEAIMALRIIPTMTQTVHIRNYAKRQLCITHCTINTIPKSAKWCSTSRPPRARPGLPAGRFRAAPTRDRMRAHGEGEMKLPRRHFLHLAAGAVALRPVAASLGRNHRRGPVRIIVPFLPARQRPPARGSWVNRCWSELGQH